MHRFSITLISREIFEDILYADFKYLHTTMTLSFNSIFQEIFAHTSIYKHTDMIDKLENTNFLPIPKKWQHELCQQSPVTTCRSPI